MLEDLVAPDTKTYTDDQLLQHCLESNDNVLESTRTLRSKWDRAWSTYNMTHRNFENKAQWQARVSLPKFKMAVRVAKASLSQALVRADKFFTFQGQNEPSRTVEKDCEHTIYRILDQAEFKEKSFPTALFRGLLENLMIFKIFPVKLSSQDLPIDPSQDYKIVIEPVSSYKFRIDPTGRNRFVIHQVEMDFADYRKLVNDGVYEKDTIDVLEADYMAQDEQYKEKSRAGLTNIPKPSWRKEVELLEYWGDVDSPEGKRIYSNVTFTVVNRKAIARKPLKNPFRHGTFPFVYGPIVEKPGCVYGENFGEGIIDVAELIDETVDIILDANLASSVKAFEVNLDVVHNPTELKSGIYPGKVIKTRGSTPGVQAVNDFSLGTLDPSALQVLASLDREFQNGTGVNEFISGMIGGMPGTTATEVRQKSAQSISFLQSHGLSIEDNVLEPTIEMVYSNILQYNPEIFGARVAQSDAELLKFKFTARGLSKILGQAEELQKLFMWIGMVAKTPIGQELNWKKVGELSVRLANQDPNDLLLSQQTAPVTPGQAPPPQDDAAMQSNQQTMMRLMAGGGA